MVLWVELAKQPEQNLDDNYAMIMRSVLNKSQEQQSTELQIYGNSLTHHKQNSSGMMWWLLRVKKGRTHETSLMDFNTETHHYYSTRNNYIPQQCANTGYCLKHLTRVIDDRKRWEREREREKGICAVDTSRWCLLFLRFCWKLC